MQPLTFDIDPANIDPDGLADGNSSAGATVAIDGALTSGGTFTSADGLGRQLVILDLGADVQTGATYTITGTNANGNAQVESLAGPGASASVETTEYFLTVTSIAIASPAAGSTVDIGTVDEVSSQVIPIDRQSGYGLNASVDVTGALNFTIQETFVDIQNQDPVWFNITALASKTANTTSSSTIGASAIRFILNSYTNTAEAQIYTNQVTGQ